MNQKEKKSGLKKWVLLSSLVLLVVSLILLYWHDSGLCAQSYPSEVCRSSVLNTFIIVSGISALSVLIFSLITFWMKERVFRKWFRFGSLYIPFFIFGYLVYPQSDGTGGIGIEGAISRGIDLFILFVVCLIYFIASTKIIIKEWFLVYKNKNIKSWILYTVLYSLAILAWVIAGLF